MTTKDELRERLIEIFELYDEYKEHEEYHVDCDRKNGHLEFDEDKAVDQILNLLEDEKQKATMPTHIMGKPIEEVITILNALELERIEDLKITMSNLNEWMERVREDNHKAMQKAIDNTFATLKKGDKDELQYRTIRFY